MILIRTTEDDRDSGYVPLVSGLRPLIHLNHIPGFYRAYATDEGHRLSIRAARYIAYTARGVLDLFSLYSFFDANGGRYRLRHDIENPNFYPWNSIGAAGIERFVYIIQGHSIIDGVVSHSFEHIQKSQNPIPTGYGITHEETEAFLIAFKQELENFDK